LGEKYLTYFSEVYAFLYELMEEINPEIEKLSKEIILLIENISGEDIRDIFK